MPRSYAIRTFGCQMNVHDSERAAGILETMGYHRTAEVDDADLVLLNTCAVRENADNKLYGTLGHLKPLKDERGTTIVVGGCLAQKDGPAISERAPWVDVVYGTHNLANLPTLLAEADSTELPVLELVEALETFPSALPAKREVRHHAWVSISVGCNNSCTFCIVPSLRGPENSRPAGDILAEVEALVADGVVEVTLLGQNVNSYGRDLDSRPLFADLLRAMGEVEGLERVRFTSPHPHDFTADVLHAMAETPNVCEHLHLPLQSGSDRVLRAMRRSYRSARFLDLVARTRELLPDAALTTDLIVGFPGETEEDFAETLRVVEAAAFDQSFTFQYSPRPGTPAAEMVDDFVEPDAVADRYQRLEALTRRLSHDAHAGLVGTRQELLVESPSKTDDTRLSGRTRGNHLVHFPRGSVRTGDVATAGRQTGGVVPAGVAPEVAPGDLVVVEVVEAATNYALGGAPIAVRTTPAGDATRRALARGDGWQLGADAVLTPPVGTAAPTGRNADPSVPAARRGRVSLPVLPS